MILRIKSDKKNVFGFLFWCFKDEYITVDVMFFIYGPNGINGWMDSCASVVVKVNRQRSFVLLQCMQLVSVMDL